jgi:hypothetical protein
MDVNYSIALQLQFLEMIFDTVSYVRKEIKTRWSVGSSWRRSSMDCEQVTFYLAVMCALRGTWLPRLKAEWIHNYIPHLFSLSSVKYRSFSQVSFILFLQTSLFSSARSNRCYSKKSRKYRDILREIRNIESTFKYTSGNRYQHRCRKF